MANVKVKETIHHGNYRHTRVVEVYALTLLTLEGILMSSAYPAVNLDTERLAHLLDNLKEQGAAQLGWADFEIVKD